MKKFLSLLCALCVSMTALVMPACSGGTATGTDSGGTESTYSQSNSSSGNGQDGNAAENTDGAEDDYTVTDDTNEGNTGGTQGSETDESNTGGTQGGEEVYIPEGATTYLARANELGSEVQNVPTPSELSEFTVTSQDEAIAAASKVLSKSGTAALAADDADDYVDLTNPEENENYQKYLSAGRNMSDTLHTFMSYGDGYVQTFKDITATALEGVIQFDTWINIKNLSITGEYKLSYDEITDVVTIDYISENGSYRYVHITSTYNDDGKSEISGYILDRFYDTIYPDMITSLNYVEDDYWEVLSEYQSDEIRWVAYNFLCGCNLSGESKEFFLFPTTANLFMFKTSSPNYIDMRKSGTGEDPYSYFDYMYNSAAEMVGYWDATISSCMVTFDIYELTGWDKFYYEDDTYYLTVNGEVIAFGHSDVNESNLVDCGDYNYWAYVSYDKDDTYMPSLRIDVNLFDGASTTLYGAICEVMQNLGISFKDDAVYGQLEYMNNAAEVFTFDAFGLDGSEAPSYELYKQVSAQYAMQKITVDEAMTYFDEDYIDESEQTKDTRYYFIFQPDISGTVALDGQSGEIDLSALTLTISAGALGVEGNVYAAIIVATDGTTATELWRATATYSGGSVTINSAEVINVSTIAEKLTSGEYTLKLYAVRVSDGEDLKISDLSDIASQGSFYFAGDDYYITITCGDAITVVYEKYVTPEVSGSIAAGEDIDLSGLSVSVAASQLAVKNGVYAAVIAAYDGTNLTELTRASTTYISGDVTINTFESISAGDIAEALLTNYGSYTLKLYIVRITDGGDIVLSGLYDVVSSTGCSYPCDGYNVTVAQGNLAEIIYEKYIAPAISGYASLTEEEGVDLTNLSVSITADELTQSGTYAATIAAYDGTNTFDIFYLGTTTYTGGDLTLELSDKVSASNIQSSLSYGCYVLKLYIVRITGDGAIVLSDLYDIASTGSYDYAANGIHISATSGETTNIIYEPYVVPSINYGAEVSDSEINLYSIQVTLYASGLYVNGEYAVVFAACTETSATELVRSSVMYTGGNATISDFDSISISAVEGLSSNSTYTLKLYIVRVTDDGDIMLSDMYDVTATNTHEYSSENVTIQSVANGTVTITRGEE